MRQKQKLSVQGTRNAPLCPSQHSHEFHYKVHEDDRCRLPPKAENVANVLEHDQVKTVGLVNGHGDFQEL